MKTFKSPIPTPKISCHCISLKALQDSVAVRFACLHKSFKISTYGILFKYLNKLLGLNFSLNSTPCLCPIIFKFISVTVFQNAMCYTVTFILFSWDTSTSSHVSNRDAVVIKIWCITSSSDHRLVRTAHVLGNNTAYKRFVFQTLLWSLE